MKAMKDTVSQSNRKFITAVLISGVILLVRMIFCVVGDMDEIWNYDLCRGVSMGYIPYRDFNMVMMPLFDWLFYIPLKISRTLLMYRIVSSLWLTGIVAALYKKAVKQVGDDLAVFLSIVFSVFMDIFTYNALFFLFAILFCLIWEREDLKYRMPLLGAVSMLSVLSRQTSGGILLILGLIIVIRCADKKDRMRSVLGYLTGFGIVGSIFLIYLLATGSFVQFWDYCFFAMFMSEGNSGFQIASIPLLLIVALGIAADILDYRKTQNRNSIIHLLLGLTVVTITIPIVDRLHTMYSVMWFAVPIVAVFRKKYSKKITANLFTIMDFGAVALGLIFVYLSFSGSIYADNIEELRYVPLPGYIQAYKDISDINKLYEDKGYSVTVFSQDAALISVVGGRFEPPYDLFLKGNLGTTDPMTYPVAACSEPDSIILITDDYRDGWENPEGVYEYVTSHGQPVYSYSQYVWYMPDQ